MDLFNTLGYTLGNIDTARERADAAEIDRLHEADDSEPENYVVTVELIVSAMSENDAKSIAHDILDIAVMDNAELLDTDILGAIDV
mgnify:FL=1|tara:strand:- start:516 stop:773 length:258 start_codon:yes stop_codon:yes gene_type:complete